MILRLGWFRNLKGVIFDFNGTLFLTIQNIFWHGQKYHKIFVIMELMKKKAHEHINGVPNNKVVEYCWWKV